MQAVPAPGHVAYIADGATLFPKCPTLRLVPLEWRELSIGAVRFIISFRYSRPKLQGA